jgi:hypothetical protein
MKIEYKFTNKCCSFRIIQWVREEVEASDGKGKERIQAVVLDMSSKCLRPCARFIEGNALFY